MPPGELHRRTMHSYNSTRHETDVKPYFSHMRFRIAIAR